MRMTGRNKMEEKKKQKNEKKTARGAKANDTKGSKQNAREGAGEPNGQNMTEKNHPGQSDNWARGGAMNRGNRKPDNTNRKRKKKNG